MPLTSSALLLAMLTTGPISTPLTPPAACVAPIAHKSNRPRRRRHRLLPTVVFGLDVAPQRVGRSRFDDELSVSDDNAIVPATSNQRLHNRRVTRWTISLRWRSSAPDHSAEPAVFRAHRHQLCDDLLSLRNQRPKTLVDAVDHWAETSRLSALIGYRREVNRD